MNNWAISLLEKYGFPPDQYKLVLLICQHEKAGCLCLQMKLDHMTTVAMRRRFNISGSEYLPSDQPPTLRGIIVDASYANVRRGGPMRPAFNGDTASQLYELHIGG